MHIYYAILFHKDIQKWTLGIGRYFRALGHILRMNGARINGPQGILGNRGYGSQHVLVPGTNGP